MASVAKYIKPRHQMLKSGGPSKDPAKRARQLAGLRKGGISHALQKKLATEANVPGATSLIQSPNFKTLVTFARANTTEALLAIIGMMRDMRCKPSVRFACAAFIVERGFGRAPQLIKIEDERPGLASPVGSIDGKAYAQEVYRILKEAGAVVPGEAVNDDAVEVSAVSVSGDDGRPAASLVDQASGD